MIWPAYIEYAKQPELPAGIRLSSPCPVRAYLQHVYPDLYPSFVRRGVDSRGHMLEDDVYEHTLLPRFERVERQVKVPHRWGIGHIDFSVYDSDAGNFTVDAKSHNKDPRKDTVAPSAANREQMDRYLLRNEQEGGKLFPEPLQILMLGTFDNSITGPFTMRLTDASRAKAELWFKIVDDLMLADEVVDPASQYVRELCWCGGCVKRERKPAGDIMKPLLDAYAQVLQGLDDPQLTVAASRVLKKRKAELRGRFEAVVQTDAVVTDGDLEVYRTRSGSLTIKKVKQEG